MQGACALCNKPAQGICNFGGVSIIDRGNCPEMKWAIYGLIYEAKTKILEEWKNE